MKLLSSSICTPKDKISRKKLRFTSENTTTTRLKNSQKLYNQMYKNEEISLEYKKKPLNKTKVLI